ncbi:hypothetical protein FNV43_RR00084 [Rhamnella rubrinervis]|uniref:F-box domain-containing protein n=1 Tax=Rhamnella rubrinervis TaxID=2594499 RepID=A0A8K0HMF1_9ROSA|nr:hypothetical protein FNV43_RR00084 [Rhamnella rubrinervis]
MEKSSDLSPSNRASLPDDLISLIIEKLVHLSDFIRFSVVCKSWNSIASYHRMQKLNQLSNHQLPWKFTEFQPYNLRLQATHTFRIHSYDVSLRGFFPWLVDFSEGTSCNSFKPTFRQHHSSSTVD